MIDDCHQNMIQEIEIPPDMMLSITPGLERLVQEKRITIETAQTVLQTRMVPLEIGHLLGLVAHSGVNLDNLIMMQSQHSQSASPLSMCSKYTNMPNAANVANVNSVVMAAANAAGATTTNTMPTILMQQYQSLQYNLHTPGGNNSGCASPVYAAGYGSGYSSPNNGGGNVSPMHQITRGIRGLTTSGGGSITRGTSSNTAAASAASVTEPLDLSMDIIQSYETESTATTPNYANMSANNWYVPPGFYNMPQINLGQRLVPTPPTSPNLCIIQEENGLNSVTPVNCPQSTPTAENIDYLHSHPQICLTDVQGSEITLVALSDSSHDSDDSLEGTHTNTTALQGLVITEPSSDMPSITRGVGRKTSLENEARNMETKLDTDTGDQYAARRGSDKSLGFSDDSLSNDSNLSPLQEPSGSSGFKSCDDSRLSPDSLSDRRLSDEYYELPLPYDCSNMESSRILEIIKKKIDSKMPPKGFTVNNEVSTTGSDTLPTDASNLNIEYSSGLQVELQVTEGRSKENKGIKLRRISGDQLEYGKLCQQLITSLTVV